MIRRSAPWSVCVQPKKGCFYIPSQIKKILKNPCGLKIQYKFQKIKNNDKILKKFLNNFKKIEIKRFWCQLKIFFLTQVKMIANEKFKTKFD